jgi:hypothetical protein
VVRLVIGGVLGLALFVFLVLIDAQFVVQAYDRSPASSLIAICVGGIAAVGTVLAFAWYRTRRPHLGATARRVLGWAGIAWAALFVVGFVWTHPRHRDDGSATALEVAVVAYCLVIVVVAVCLLPVAILRLSRPSRHDPENRVQVVELRHKKPYFVAYCECGWVGPAYDADTPAAQDQAFRDARQHGTNVASDVERPLG